MPAASVENQRSRSLAPRPQATSGAPDAGQVEFETKYVLPTIAAAAVASWLRGRCRRDPQYPESGVTSVYYDTPTFEFLRQKIDSDFRKTKVRLRWYTGVHDGRIAGPAFLEIKRKVGSRRFKTRMRTPEPTAQLASPPLESACWLRILRLLGHQRTTLPTELRPVMEISFHRLRFVDPVSGDRLSLDRDIRPSRVHAGLLPGTDASPLSHAVLELKSSRRYLPLHLLPLVDIGCRKSSFSKYERCWMRVVRRTAS